MTQYVPGMSLAEVKTSVEAMSIDDRLDVAAFYRPPEPGRRP